MHKIFTLSILFLVSLSMMAQEPEAPETSDDTKTRQFSTKNIGNDNDDDRTYIGFGFLVGENEFENANPQGGASNEVIWGSRTMVDLGNQQFAKLGFDAYYRFSQYRLEQDSAKTFPSSTIFSKERLSTHGMGLELFIRFRFDKNYDKKYGYSLDIGAYGEWNFARRHVIWQKYEDEDFLGDRYFKTQKAISKRVGYINPWEYGLSAKLGVKNFTIYSTYRLSNFFKKDFDEDIIPVDLSQDLPKISVGLQLRL